MLHSQILWYYIDLEAGYGFGMGKESSRPGCKMVHWQNDWYKFKRLFKAAGRLNRIAEALKYGEMLACKANKNVKDEIDNEQEGSFISPYLPN